VVVVVKMKFTTIAAALLPLAATAAFTTEEYDSGEVMAKMMQAKEVRGPISS
jgi:D-alanyl-D-alanine carboxypeptidase